MPSPSARPLLNRVAFTLAALAALAMLPGGPPAFAAKASLEDFDVSTFRMGGDFALTNQDGKTTGLRDFRGKVVVVFFGYTYCPDVCPLTLSDVGRMNQALGKDAAKVQSLFVTIDPARDTAPRLKSYLGNFDPSIIGLTGSERDITQVAKLFRTRFAKRGASGDGYLMDHTAFVYLIDVKGKVRYMLPYDVGMDVLADGARQLLNN